MTKEVLLSLKGLQFTAEEDSEQLETITPARYYKRNGSHFVIYEEVTEGFEESTQNMVKFGGELLEVTKKGLINVHMVFEEHKKNMTSYATPYGEILIGIDTGSVNIKEVRDQISINVEYSLEANYEHMADCRIEMNIRPREDGFAGF